MTRREPKRTRPEPALSARMSALARRDTKPELLVRSELHRRGLRYQVQMKVPGNNRRTIDIAFPRVRLAVYIDGCFWHGCPEHHLQPKTNSDWWIWKIQRNQARDRDTDDRLVEQDWQVLRIWEHQTPSEAADLVERTYRQAIERLRT